MKKWISAFVLILVVHASSYTLFMHKWAGSAYYYYINPIGVDDDVDYSSKNGLIVSSIGVWDGVSTSVARTQFLGTTTDETWAGSEARNNQNTITWKTDGWSANVIGVAATWFSGSSIIESDIKLNTAFVNDSRVHLLVTHESGHSMGIGHTRESGESYSAEEYNAVMFWLLHSQTGINCQDRCALTAIYPNGTCAAPYASGNQNCLPCCGGANTAPSTFGFSFSADPAHVAESVTCTIVASDPDMHDVQVALDWGDGTITEFSSLQSSGSSFPFQHTFAAMGTYVVKSVVKDEYGLQGSWTTIANLQVQEELPVELSLFSAIRQADGVELQWTTESEQINLGFILERKSASAAWQTIADYLSAKELRGQGTTTQQSRYTFIDNFADAGQSLFYRLSDVSMTGERTIIGEIVVTAATASTPQQFKLYSAFPNPFNPQTKIAYDLPAAGHTKLTIFSVDGKAVQTLVDESQNAGSYQITWNAENFPSGIYLIRLQCHDFFATQRVVLLK